MGSEYKLLVITGEKSGTPNYVDIFLKKAFNTDRKGFFKKVVP